MLPDLEVLQPWLRAAWGPWHCAPLRQAGLETVAEADLKQSCSSPVFVLSLSVILLVCYRWELSAMTTNSTISRPIVSNQG